MQSKERAAIGDQRQGFFPARLPCKTKVVKFGSLSVCVADLEAADMLVLSRRLIAAQEKLAETSIFKIVEWIDQASAQWRDPNHAVRREAQAIIPRAGGLSKEMLRFVLDDLFQNLSQPVLMKFLGEELGNAGYLDRFCPKDKGLGFTRAFGPRLITQIVPSTVSGISLICLVCGLLVKSANLLRVSPPESLLPVLFAQSLQESWPDMAEALAIVSWSKAAEAVTEAAFKNAEAAVVYGRDETLTTLSGKIPYTTKIIRYGHRLSLGIVARESIQQALADKAALDIALYDQKGCLSPHLFYVEEDGENTALAFAQWLAQSLYALSLRLPKGTISPGEAAQIHQIRGALPLKGGIVFSSPDALDWTVFYDPDPAFACSPLSRSIWIKPVKDLSQVPKLISPYCQSLQGIGFAIPEERQPSLIPMMAQIGGSRICPIGQMQTPPMTWHHDGGFRLLPLLRFVDWENP